MRKDQNMQYTLDVYVSIAAPGVLATDQICVKGTLGSIAYTDISKAANSMKFKLVEQIEDRLKNKSNCTK